MQATRSTRRWYGYWAPGLGVLTALLVVLAMTIILIACGPQIREVRTETRVLIPQERDHCVVSEPPLAPGILGHPTPDGIPLGTVDAMEVANYLVALNKWNENVRACANGGR